MDMVNKILVGVAIGVFFAGIGIGYAIFYATNQSQLVPGPMGFDQRQQMMQQFFEDPQSRQQMLSYMMQDPEQVDMWLIQNPQHVQQMSKAMKQNHDFMQEMMFAIIDDPALRIQMLGHMTENQETMQQMQKMIQGNMTKMGMDSGMMMNP